MNEESLKKELIAILNKAFRSLAAAERMITEGDYDFASSRSYYAVFYAMEAILLTKGLTFSKHAGVISGFNQFFIKTGLFPKEFNTMISRLFRQRQTGDYDFEPGISEQDARKDLEIANQVLTALEEYLNKNFLKP